MNDREKDRIPVPHDGGKNAAGDRRMAVLNVYSKSGTLLSSLPLEDGTYTIGRGDDCDIQCEGAANVSRHHARLTVKGRQASIKDLNSTVGMMVNSKIVTEADLGDGDSIQLGMMKFSFHLPPLQEEENEKKAQKYKAVEHSDAVEHLDRDLSDLAEKCHAIREEVAKVIVGQQDIVEGVLGALLCQGHCLLVGVPGLAKTVMVCTFAKVLGLTTQRIQFTPDLMPSDIIGSEMLKKKENDSVPELQFVQGPIFTQLLLADEINRTPPKTQAALLEAMQERQVTVSMKSYQLPLPFCVIATQNPIEQEGTYPLPEAQQDRFMFCLHLDYPALKEEMEIMVRTTSGTVQPECRGVIEQNEIIRFQQIVKNVGVPDEQLELAVNIVRATRPRSPEAERLGLAGLIDWGAGPRAGQALIRGAKVFAAMDGRPAVSRNDIGKLLLPVLRHRISCSYRARSEGMNEDDIIRIIQEKMNLQK